MPVDDNICTYLCGSSNTKQLMEMHITAGEGDNIRKCVTYNNRRYMGVWRFVRWVVPSSAPDRGDAWLENRGSRFDDAVAEVDLIAVTDGCLQRFAGRRWIAVRRLWAWWWRRTYRICLVGVRDTWSKRS